jgi:hypothetical protein
VGQIYSLFKCLHNERSSLASTATKVEFIINNIVGRIIMMRMDSIDESIGHIKSVIEVHEKMLQKYIERKNNIQSFMDRYGDLISDSDGIFGLFPDEIIIHILSYLSAKELLKPPCRRFYQLREEALKCRKYGVSDTVIDRYITGLFTFPIVFHFAYDTGNLHRNQYITNSNEKSYSTDYVYTANAQRSMYVQRKVGDKSSKIAIINHKNNITVCTKKYIIVIKKSNFTHAIYHKNTGTIVKRPGIFGKHDNLTCPEKVCNPGDFTDIFTDIFL